MASSMMVTDIRLATRSLARHAAARHQVPIALAERAATAARSALSGSVGSPMSERDHARVSAYFWAVVRRHAARDSRAGEFAQAMVVDAIASDLRSAGWDSTSIARELQRTFGQREAVA